MAEKYSLMRHIPLGFDASCHVIGRDATATGARYLVISDSILITASLTRGDTALSARLLF